MSSSFYPLGMNSYNNRLPQGGYKSSKGTGVFSNPTGVTAGNIRPLTNNDPSNSVPQKFGLPRPIKHYRKGISVTSLDNSTNSRQVKSSTGGGSLIGQMIDIPGGFSIKENPSNETSNTEELDNDCKTCQGVGIISDWQPITDLTEKPQPETQTPQYCCNEERNALRRSRSSNTKLKKNYYTSTTNYLYNRCQTFEQKQFNYLSTGNAATKPGAPLSQDNIYKANCNPNLEIQFTESQLPDGITLTPSNPLGCETVQYKPNNYKYGQQGAVSSSDRLLRLNVETIDTNRANIIKSQENLTKSKYFPNASGSENNSCCIIGSKAVSSFGTTILYITYPLVTRTFRTLTHRFSFPSSFSSISDAPVPVIQNEYILVVPSYELIDPNTNKVKMTLKYQLFTNNDAELLTVGLSFANNVDYYNQNTSIIEIIQFDGMPLYGLGNQFSGLTPQILISAPDEPRIINGTSALNCFKDCPNFNSPGILNWNIANVVNLQGIFANATLFNQPVGSWDTSNVTNMSYMFYGASAFNQDISMLDTSAVEDMSHMFEDATIFNNGEPGIQAISGTAASSNYIDSTRTLSCPNGLFLTELSLNDGIVISSSSGVVYSSQIQPPIVSDVSLVLLTAYGGNLIAGTITSIQKIPTSVGGNVPLSSWNTGNVQDMKKMFQYALSFNQYIGDWDTQSVTEMSSMFVFASSFNNGQISGSSTESLNAWNTGSVTLMNNMFQNASAFNQPIGDWDTHSVTDMQVMFKITQFNQPLITNGDKWNTGSVENMRYMFQQTSAFNQDISSWNTENVTNLSYMFYKALAFNNGETGTMDISGNPFTSAFYTNSTTLLTSTGSQFRTQLSPSDVLIITAGTPTTPIIYTSQIQTSPIVSDVSLVLLTAYGSNIAAGTITSIKKQVIGTADLSWNTSILPDLQYMFSDATYFNQNVSSFTVGNATNMFSSSSTSLRGIFNNGQLAGSNNNSLRYWNTVASGSIGAMFVNSAGFNQNISNWNVSNVVYAGQVFQGAQVYNNGLAPGVVSNDSSLNSWNTTKFNDIQVMFNGAVAFNQNISNWDVSKVYNMNATFSGATLFNNGDTPGLSNNPLTNWRAPLCKDFVRMFRIASSFNQAIPILVDSSGIIIDAQGNGVDLTQMFQSASVFNQNLNTWNTSRVTNMTNMFISATAFNNGSLTNDGANELLWTVSNCTSFAGMFNTASSFNQKVNNLVNTANVIDCSLNSMFQAATIFNNGQIGTIDISGSTPFTYTDGTRLLTSTGSKFLRDLSSNDVLIITAGTPTTTTIYTSQIQPPIVSDISLVLLTAYGGALTTASITSIKKQVAGSAPLTWNTTNVKNMSSLFLAAYYFNQQLPWNVSNATNMSSMFATGSTALRNIFNNGQLAGSSGASLNWYASNCTNFTSMFAYTSGFNQPTPTLVDTSGVALQTGCTLTSMFQNTTVFNQNISNWNVSRVTNMTNMFNTASAFNNGSATNDGANTLTWNAPNCLFFSAMFSTATAFNQPIANLVDTSNLVGVCALNSMFSGATLFNQNLNTWNVSRVTAMNSMFLRPSGTTAFNNGRPLGVNDTSLNWYAPNCTTFALMFSNSIVFNQPIPFLVDTSGISLPTGCNLTQMFQNAAVFNQNLNGWNVSRVRTMILTFSGATSFNNGDISGNSSQPLTWYAPNCTSFSTIFNTVSAFNQPLPYLVDTSGNTDPSGCSLNAMFQAATRFNQNLNTWNVSRATTISLTFSGASAFNNGRPVGTNDTSLNWYAPNCTTFASMFLTANSFNQPIPNLVDTSGIALSTGCSLSAMFQNAQRFNQNLNTWNVSRVTDMSLMFNRTTGSTAFNNGSLINDASNTLTWYAPNCTTFASMFNASQVFNQPITNLVDTSGVTDCSFTTMFQNANLFNQNISAWNVSRVTNMSSMFNGATAFNNGQLLPPDISGNVATASYTNSSKLLTCTGGNFTTLTSADVLIITTTALVYSSQIQTTPVSDVSLVLLTAYGADILSGITSIKKQVAGTADLSWNTQLVTTTATMFQNATYFNQRLPWNMRLNRNVTSMFAATTSSPATPQKFINLFNNGQILTGTSQRLYPGGGANIWDFSGGTITGGTSGAWRLNSRLIISGGNGVTINPALT